MRTRMFLFAAVLIGGALGMAAVLSSCGGPTSPSGSASTVATRPKRLEKVAVSFSSNIPKLLTNETSPSDAKTSQEAESAHERPDSPRFGRVEGVVKWHGPLPQLEPIPVSKDPHVCAEHGRHERPSEQLIVNPLNGGIKDSVVHLVGKFQHGKPLSELKHPDTLNQRLCSYQPRVMVLPMGTRLAMTSDDEVGHNIRMAGATQMNLAISKGKRIKRRLQRPGVIQLACDIHPWMSGYIHVVKHPYYAITDSDGRFELTDVPAGTHKIRLWHEAWWQTQDKASKPLVAKRSFLVEAGKTTQVTFELSFGRSGTHSDQPNR